MNPRWKLLALIFLCASLSRADVQQGALETTTIRLSFGYRSPSRIVRSVRLLPGSAGVKVSLLRGEQLEDEDRIGQRALLHAGAGDVDVLVAQLSWNKPAAPRRQPQEIWKYLFAHSTPQAVARLKDDSGLTPDAPLLTVELSEDGTKGFSVGIEQLLRHKAMWLPEQDAFLTLAGQPVDFEKHLAYLQGQRILDRVAHQPEATLAEFESRWQDMGDPNSYHSPWEEQWLGARGHVIPIAGGLGSIYKFGIYRSSAVRPDLASPHKFRLNFRAGSARWVSQRLTNGLPVILTNYLLNGQQIAIEQFACPRNPSATFPPGQHPMCLLTQVRITGQPGPIQLGFEIGGEATHLELSRREGHWTVSNPATGEIWLLIQTDSALQVRPPEKTSTAKNAPVVFEIVGDLAPGQQRQFTLKLPSPALRPDSLPAFASLDFASNRAATLRYWEGYLAQGATFEVPEPSVNELFRANLWHALVLPRFRTQNGQDWIDFPYSNFAYGQKNADWPVNQAVYVDYMLYALRGHFDLAEQELAAMYRSQQMPDGRISGYANWATYSPSMLYAAGKLYLLSDDRQLFEKLLPQSKKTLDYCLRQLDKSRNSPPAPGLIAGPLNDLTHEDRPWAWPQAYYVAALESFGRALRRYGDPEAAPCLAAAPPAARHRARIRPRQRQIAHRPAQ